MNKPKAPQTVFAFKPGMLAADGIPTLAIAVSEQEWKSLGSTLKEADLRAFGLPLRVVLARCNTTQAGINMLKRHGFIPDDATPAAAGSMTKQ